MLKRSAAATLAAFALLVPAAHAGWRQPVDAVLDANPAASASAPATAVLDGAPYAAWIEDRAVRAARLGAGGWEAVGGPLRGSGTDAYAPSLGAGDGHLYAAWWDYQLGIAVARSADGGWQMLPPLGDAFSSAPSIAVLDGVPYVAYQQGTSGGFDIRVARLSGDSWQPVGGALDASEREPDPLPPVLTNPNVDAGEPALATAGGTLYVAWIEGGTVRAARLEGERWPLIGDAVTAEGAPSEPDIDISGGSPYVAWKAAVGRFEVRMARFDGTSWSQPAPAVSGGLPELQTIGGTPWLAWREAGDISRARVARLGALGTSWEQPTTGINRQNVHGLSLLGVAGIPFLAYGEGPTSAVADVRVARLEPEFVSTTATAAATEATLVTRLVTFGLPYRVGFAVAGTRTPAEVATGDPATVAATVTGLSPRTTYTAAPFATAGAGPEVPGPPVTFTTTKKNGR